MAKVNIKIVADGSKQKHYKTDPDFTCKRKDCIYRNRNKSDAYKCSYWELCGKIRKSAPGREKPANCDKYVSERTPEGRAMYLVLREEQRQRYSKRQLNPCFDCPDKYPGCNCEKRKIYQADKEKQFLKKLQQARIDEYMHDSIESNKLCADGKYWDKYRQD